MTLRKIVNDIRTHASHILHATGLSPVVSMAGDDAISDVIHFQTKSGQRHVVAIAVPKDVGERSWDRAAIAPVSIRTEHLTGTGWEMRCADGVPQEDIVGFKTDMTDKDRVALIIEHIDARGAEFMPYDDPDNRICTDSRLPRIVERLRHVANLSGMEPVIELADKDMSAANPKIDWVELFLENEMSVIVALEEGRMSVTLDAIDPFMSEFEIETMAEFDKVIEEILETLSECRNSAFGHR